MTNNPHILVIEDDQDLNEIYQRALKNVGFEVTATKNGQQGLLLAQSENVDLIMLDVILPEMDGFEILNVLKSDPGTTKIPVIMITNLGNDHDINTGKKNGAHDYLVKADYTPQQIVERVKKILTEHGTVKKDETETVAN
ncbi:MAG: response regulator [bacterium]